MKAAPGTNLLAMIQAQTIAKARAASPIAIDGLFGRMFAQTAQDTIAKTAIASMTPAGKSTTTTTTTSAGKSLAPIDTAGSARQLAPNEAARATLNTDSDYVRQHRESAAARDSLIAQIKAIQTRGNQPRPSSGPESLR